MTKLVSITCTLQHNIFDKSSNISIREILEIARYVVIVFNLCIKEYIDLDKAFINKTKFYEISRKSKMCRIRESVELDNF